MKRERLTFTGYLISAGLVLVGSIAVGALVAGYVLGTGIVGSEQASDPSAEPSGERAEPCPEGDQPCLEWHEIQDSPTQHPTAAQLIAAHDCWTGAAPADVDLPGGVVARVDGGDPEYSENAAVIGAALDAALDGADNGVTAVAFCRGDS